MTRERTWAAGAAHADRRWARAALLLVLCVAIMACRSGEAGDVGVVLVRDSAGITIVESTAAAWAPGERWQMDAEPALRIGRQEGDARYLFAGIVGAVRLDDGRIVVGDRTSGQVRFYDGNGEFEKAMGGKGQGPGEFEYMRALSRCARDTIFAFDLSWSAVLVSLAGDYVGDFLPYAGPDPASARPYALACSRRGDWIATGWQRLDGPPTIGFYAARAPVWILRRVEGEDGVVAGGRLRRIDVGEFVTSERIGTEHGSRPHPFGRGAVVAISDDAVFVGTAESLEVREYSVAGELRRILRGPAVDLTIRDADVRAWVDGEVARAKPQSRAAVEREYREMPLPPSFSAYTEALTDPEGALWLQRFVRPTESGQSWAVFSREGVYLGDVAVPQSLKVLEIGSDYLLGVAVDELGVERIELYGLHRNG